jgi:hypothetical protein
MASADVMTNPALKSRRIEDAWAAYEGDAPRPLRVGRDGSTDNVRVNLGRWMVDSYSAWLFGRDIAVTADDTDATAPVEVLIDTKWPMAKRMTQLLHARLEGAVSGHAFMRVTQDRVIVLPSDGVTVMVDPMDGEHVLGYQIDHMVAGDQGATTTFRQIHARQYDEASGAEFWTITDMVSGRMGKFEVTGEVVWPFAQSQIVSTQNLTGPFYWGTPDLTRDVLELIASIERALTNAAKITRIHASPIAYTKGLDSDGQRAYDRRDPASVIHLADDTQLIGHDAFNGAGITSTIELYDKLVATFHKLTGLPNEEADAAGLTAASGASLELRLTGMIQRVNAYRRTYGHLIEAVCERIQIFNGLEPVEVRPVWPSVLPEDAMEGIVRAKELAALGASQETVLKTAGLNPEVEAARIEAERPADIGALLDRIDNVAPAAEPVAQ